MVMQTNSGINLVRKLVLKLFLLKKKTNKNQKTTNRVIFKLLVVKNSCNMVCVK